MYIPKQNNVAQNDKMQHRKQTCKRKSHKDKRRKDEFSFFRNLEPKTMTPVYTVGQKRAHHSKHTCIIGELKVTWKL